MGWIPVRMNKDRNEVQMNRRIIAHITHEAIGKIRDGAVLEGFYKPGVSQCNGRTILIIRCFIRRERGFTARAAKCFILLGGKQLRLRLSADSNSTWAQCRAAHLFDPIPKSKARRRCFCGYYMDSQPINQFEAACSGNSNSQPCVRKPVEYDSMSGSAHDIKVLSCGTRRPRSSYLMNLWVCRPFWPAYWIYDFKTVFYAHEVAPMRRIVEGHSGHDTMFYNVLRKAHQQDLYVNDVFGDQSHFFKYALVDAARHCDNILAVGNCVVDELRFLAPEFNIADIDLTYNGIPAYQVGLAEKYNPASVCEPIAKPARLEAGFCFHPCHTSGHHKVYGEIFVFWNT